MRTAKWRHPPPERGSRDFGRGRRSQRSLDWASFSSKNRASSKFSLDSRKFRKFSLDFRKLRRFFVLQPRISQNFLSQAVQPRPESAFFVNAKKSKRNVKLQSNPVRNPRFSSENREIVVSPAGKAFGILGAGGAPNGP